MKDCHVNFRWVMSGRGQSLIDMPAFVKKACEHQNTASFPGKLLAKPGDGICPGAAVRVRQSGELLAASGTRQPGRPSSTRIE